MSPRPALHAARPVLAVARVALPALLALAVGGCFDAPTLEDRWTRLDLVSANVTPGQVVAPGVADSIRLSADITYRAIVTGYVVAELRASSVPTGAVTLAPDAPRLQMARDVDRILANSVTLGRSIRAVTGWDHLIQRVDLAFSGTVPDSAAADSGGVFLLCYLGSGKKLELPSGQDSIVVTPFDSQRYQLLPFGLPLTVAAPGNR